MRKRKSEGSNTGFSLASSARPTNKKNWMIFHLFGALLPRAPRFFYPVPYKSGWRKRYLVLCIGMGASFGVASLT